MFDISMQRRWLSELVPGLEGGYCVSRQTHATSKVTRDRTTRGVPSKSFRTPYLRRTVLD
jgi:hypothetical protein